MAFDIYNTYLQTIVIGLGYRLIIYFCVLIKQPDAAAFSAIKYLLLVLTYINDKYLYTIIRLAETVVGIILAIDVNILLKGKIGKSIAEKLKKNKNRYCWIPTS